MADVHRPAEVDVEQRAELEALSDRAMPGTQRDRIGQWVLRSDRGATGRANSLWPVGDPGCDLATAIDRAEAWFAERQLKPHVMIFDDCDPAVSTELSRRGYLQRTGSDVMMTSIAELNRQPFSTQSPDWAVDVTTTPTEATTILTGDTDRLAENATTFLPQRYVAVRHKDELLGGGIGTIDDDWIGVFAMKTMPAARRRGVASLVLRSLVAAGQRAGATKVWLQVMPDNTGAKNLYVGLGFEVVHAYHYLVAPFDAAEPSGC